MMSHSGILNATVEITYHLHYFDVPTFENYIGTNKKKVFPVHLMIKMMMMTTTTMMMMMIMIIIIQWIHVRSLTTAMVTPDVCGTRTPGALHVSVMMDMKEMGTHVREVLPPVVGRMTVTQTLRVSQTMKYGNMYVVVMRDFLVSGDTFVNSWLVTRLLINYDTNSCLLHHQ